MWYLCACVLVILLFPSSSMIEEDILQPYKTHHGPVHRRLRDTQHCQSHRYGNTTYSLHAAHVNQSDYDHVVDIHHKLTRVGEYFYMQRNIAIRFQRVYNPQRTFSVLEPGHRGSCEEDERVRATVAETALNNKCLVAANAGFFNTHTGQCLGNIVSEGRLVQDSGGIQNVHFGITKQGHLFTGYLSEIELVTLQFQQLIGGVVWLLRDGQEYVDESRDIECPDTEETGTLDRFISVVSARTAVGHDAEGHILMVQVDGKTDQRGVDLHEFAGLLKDLGFVNAINLDGGGSATSFINGTLVNYPSDTCMNKTWNCARAVSTILCVHPVDCSAHAHCSHHGDCVSGRCHCHSPWSGEACDSLTCPGDCNGHGFCLQDGCVCEAGWQGQDCSRPCDEGMFGVNCSHVCRCENNATCQLDSGLCLCPPGFTGRHCQHRCAYGYYGDGCQKRCFCPDECFCHHVTGACSNSTDTIDYMEVGQCIAANKIRQEDLVPDQSDQLFVWQCWAVSVTAVALISVAVNVWLATVVKRLQGCCEDRRLGCCQSSHRDSDSCCVCCVWQGKSRRRIDKLEWMPLRGAESGSSVAESSDDVVDKHSARFQHRLPLTRTGYR